MLVERLVFEKLESIHKKQCDVQNEIIEVLIEWVKY